MNLKINALKLLKMPQVILYNQHSDNEHSYVSVEKNVCCCLCNKLKKVIMCDNSEDDNSCIALCLECCTKILQSDI